MPLRTEETFQLQAPPDRVWAYMVDPRQVVNCLPGAELTSVEDESTFLGKVKVKVGPVVAAYSGKVVITERDEVSRTVRLVGEGRETAGSGSAKVTITSTIVAMPTGATEVRVTADLDIVGRIAQFGRGMIESVNKQMFRQFTECVRATLEARVEPVVAPDSTVPASPSDGSGAPPALAPHPAHPHPPPTAVSAATPSIAPAAQATADNTRFSPRPPQPAAGQPVRLLPVLGRALWDYVTSLVRRLFGRGPARSGRDA